MATELHVGKRRSVNPVPTGCLYIGDDLPDIPRALIFDPLEHTLNPLAGMTDLRARELAELLYLTAPQATTTLTVRDGARGLARAIRNAAKSKRGARFDKISGTPEIDALIADVLFSDLMRRVLCSSTNEFKMPNNTVVIAHLDRTVIGDFDAKVLAFLLMGQYKGQIVVPDFGFYGRIPHARLVYENRLIAGVNTLSELPSVLKDTLLLSDELVGAGAIHPDAVELAIAKGHRPDPDHTLNGNPYDDFIADAMK